MRWIFASIILFNLSAFAQQSNQNVKIIQDSRIDTLIEKHIQSNDFNPHIEGYRIQIFFESGNYSKAKAIEVKSQFVSKYREVPVYLIFQEPYYKVRIGDYRTKIEAEAFLKQISNEYTDAFVVKDEINYPPLLSKKEKQ